MAKTQDKKKSEAAAAAPVEGERMCERMRNKMIIAHMSASLNLKDHVKSYHKSPPFDGLDCHSEGLHMKRMPSATSDSIENMQNLLC